MILIYSIVKEFGVTLAVKNGLCEEDGLQHVNDFDDCRRAVSKVLDRYPLWNGHTRRVSFNGLYTVSTNPPGCFINRLHHYWQLVYFNPGSGQKCQYPYDCHQICYEGN